MTNEGKEKNSQVEISKPEANRPAVTWKISNWIIYAWGFLTLIIAALFVLSFILKPNSDVIPVKSVSRTSKSILPSQTVWMENFDNASLKGWTIDWADLRESEDGKGQILLAYRNLEPEKGSEVTFIPMNKERRFYYAKSPVIPLDFSKPYWISFDFHGKGPIELLNFGQIRLRLLSDLASLSYDPDGNQSYRKLNLPSKILDSSSQDNYSFKITVQPNEKNYEIWINGQSIGRIQYSNQIHPLNQIYFRELPPSSGVPVVNAIYYDNFQIYGTPTQPVNLPLQGKTKGETSISTIPISMEYKKYYQEGWDKYNSRDFVGAIKSFKQAIDENPKSAEAFNGLGVAYFYSGDTQSAWKAWVQALSIDSTYEPAQQNLGMK